MRIKKQEKLSPREIEVLSLLQQGNNRKMIAEQLQIKYNTVHSYCKSIYRKLNVNSVTGAIHEMEKRKQIDSK
jgi:DNA-binding NarL/FixJ family response regulator